jgi:hypothetical protein
MNSLRKLNLYCGKNPLKGYINHDLTAHSDYVDISFDINTECWGITCSNQYDEINANYAILYAVSGIRFIDNCWKSLRKGGQVKLKLCKQPRYDDILYIRNYTPEAIKRFVEDKMYSPLNWKSMDIKNNIITLKK